MVQVRMDTAQGRDTLMYHSVDHVFREIKARLDENRFGGAFALVEDLLTTADRVSLDSRNWLLVGMPKIEMSAELVRMETAASLVDRIRAINEYIGWADKSRWAAPARG